MDKKWFLRGAFFSLLALVGLRGAGLVRSIVLARVLGPSQFGQFTIAISLLSSIMVFAAFGLPKAAVKYIAESNHDEEMQGRLLTTIIAIAAVLSMLFGLAVILGSREIAVGIYQEEDLNIPFKVVGAIVIARAMFDLGIAILQGFKRIRKRALYLSLSGILSLVLASGMALYWQLEGALLGWFISIVISAILAFKSVDEEVRKRAIEFKVPDWRLIRGVGRFSLGAFLAGGVVIPAYWFGDTVLATNAGFQEVGWLGIARSFGDVIIFIPAAIAVPLIPSVAEGDLQQTRRNFADIFRTNWVLVLWAGLGIVLCANWLIPAIYGSEYQAASKLVALYALVAFFNSAGSIYGSILLGIGRIWIAFLLNGVWGIFFIIGISLLVPRYGANGLVAAYLLSYAVFFAISVIYGWASLRLRIPSFHQLFFATSVLWAVGFWLSGVQGWLYLLLVPTFIFVGVLLSWIFLLEKNSKSAILEVLRNFLVRVVAWRQNPGSVDHENN